MPEAGSRVSPGLRRWLALAIFAFAVGVIVFGATRIAELDSERVRGLLAGAGIWAPLLYVLAFSLLEPFGVFGFFFVAPGSLLWDWPQLFVLSWLGAVGAGVVGFTFARGLGRGWVESRIPLRMRRYDARLAENALLGVIVLRLVFFIAPPVHWMLGLSQVRFWPFLLGSAIGFAPGMALYTWVGKSSIGMLLEQPAWVWAAAAFGCLGFVWLFRRFRPAAPPSQT